MNGLLMKGPEAVRPMPPMDKVKNREKDDVETACAKQANDAVGAGGKEVGDKNTALVKPVVKQIEDSIYVMQYYLDPQFVATPDTKEPWIQLLEKPWKRGDVTVSVGPAGGPVWPTVATIQFERIHWVWVLCWAILFVLAVILFIRFARQSDIIRDPGELVPNPGAPTQKKAYSLARTQMPFGRSLLLGSLCSFLWSLGMARSATGP
jgi:hypothetical protein